MTNCVATILFFYDFLSNSYYPEFGWGGILVRVVTAEISVERAWERAFSVSARAGAQADDAQFQAAGHFFGHPGCHMNWHVGAEYLVNPLNTLDQTAT